MNSWDKSDTKISEKTYTVNSETYMHTQIPTWPSIGPKDIDLMLRLRKAGADHRKYLRMIVVWTDITAPLYWWKEFDTYKVGTVADSCSTMHKIAAKEFTMDDFSHDHLAPSTVIKSDTKSPIEVLSDTISVLNNSRKKYLETKDKAYWWEMIQLLPSSYNQNRTVELNYEVLTNIYFARKNHKLDEWHVFCDWIEKLPYSQIITL
jgi:hypothetical protein